MSVKNVVTYTATSLLMSVIGSLSMILMLSQSVSAAELTVNVTDVEKGKGHLLVALYQGDENYKSGKTAKASKVKAERGEEVVVFKDLADGEYAIKMYQDENDNEKLDTNMLGIPKEGYGFSNNVGAFGQPEYKEAKFIVKENTVIEIDLF